MSRIFIFTAATGAGHNLAARSIAQVLSEHGHEADIYDAFKESSSMLDRLMSNGYKQMIEYIPKFYEQMYNRLNRGVHLRESVFAMLSKFMNPDIVPLIQEKKPDLLISTHPFITQILGIMREHSAYDVPVLAFVTDYKAHKVYVHDCIDAYVVGSEYTRDTLIEKGVPAEHVFPYGIPIRKEFIDDSPRSRVRREGLHGTILLMAGSLGTRQMERAFSALMQAKEPFKLVVVCGNNDKVRHTIEAMKNSFNTDKVVEIYGFVDNIPQLMDEADAIISKPGGLTSTEAIVKNIPMIIPYYYPGQEEENADYLVESGMALKVDKIKELTAMVDFLIEHQYIIHQMSVNMSEEAGKRSMKKTIELCSTLIAHHGLPKT